MTEIEKIRKALGDFSGKYGPAAVIPATIISVNSDDTVKVVTSTGLELDDVRLKSVVKSGSKFILIPKPASVVQIARIENSDEYIVIAVEEITQVKSVTDTVEFNQNGSGFLFKKGSENFSKLMADLIDALLAEIHMTNVGPTAGLTPDSITKYNLLKQRFAQFLRTS